VFEIINDATNAFKNIKQFLKTCLKAVGGDPKQDWALKTIFRTSVDEWVAHL